MATSGTPCGACKFLRRRCVRGCVFAPYFCHEQGASHFAAIHKVFGASNVSKHLAHIPVNYRCEAAVTISYEAQARLQDPIYGCVSHIFALQQQVVSLQSQLAMLKELQAAQCIINSSNSTTGNPNDQEFEHESDVSWKCFQNQGISQLDAYQNNNENTACYPNGSSSYLNCEKTATLPKESSSFDSLDSLESQSADQNWPIQDELLSLTYRYIH